MSQSCFSAGSTTDDVLQGIDLNGRVVVITGASSGLGLEAARAMGMRGASLVLVARSVQKLDGAIEMLAQEGVSKVESVVLDLASLSSVRAGAEEILQAHQKIDVLLNNAGIMACPLERTADGFEQQFGTNHLGHFLLTALLMPALLKAEHSRVVSLSSAGHKIAAFDFEDPNYQQRDYEKWQAYGESKTANALFAIGLDQRVKHLGVRSFAVHPGMIATDLGRHLNAEDFKALADSAADSGISGYKSIPQGAATSVWAACHPDLEGQGGRYLEDCQFASPAQEGKDGGYMGYAVDPLLADKLWQLSEHLLEQHFEFESR